ncbi:hypothetical protein [Streptomyces sp. NPDC001348]
MRKPGGLPSRTLKAAKSIAAAVDSFLHGYQLAVGIAAVCTAVAGGLAWSGFRHRAEAPRPAACPPAREREATVTADGPHRRRR